MKAMQKQSGDAVWGTGGRRFESSRSDQSFNDLAESRPGFRTDFRTNPPLTAREILGASLIWTAAWVWAASGLVAAWIRIAPLLS